VSCTPSRTSGTSSPGTVSAPRRTNTSALPTDLPATVLPKRDTLAKINLGCYQQLQDRAATETYYAEILQVCADVDLANEARVAETAADAARPMLENARDAATLALKILRPYLDAVRKALGDSVFEAIRPRKLFEVQEQLMRVRDQAVEGLRKT
jgi:hypothetical protein